jgi:hypothetical protein
MSKRDILNYLGDKIGELELPLDTPEEVWQKKLAAYAKPPVAPKLPNISARQIRLQLVYSGISLASVEAALDGLSEPTRSLSKIEWEYANEFERNNALADQVGSMLGLSETDLNAFWLAASLL